MMTATAIELPLRERLQAATRGVHDRMHGHPGFAAVLDGTIDRPRYSALLIRLYGFYLPFEAAAGLTPHRTSWLAHDLQHINHDARVLAVAPQCPMPRYQTAHHITGALYVVEGSALGGRAMARSLDALLGVGTNAGRRFLLGHGADTGNAWRAFLTTLAHVPTDPSSQCGVVNAAVDTFATFEEWLNGWDTAHHDH
jgi:heme oxygenase (biliverdin-IX-beta and delta-forming)